MKKRGLPRSLGTAPKRSAYGPSARPRPRRPTRKSARGARRRTVPATGAAAARGPTTGPRRAAASVATMGPDAVVLATATRAAAASATRAAVAALVMRVPEGAAASVMLAGAALEMMLLPAAGALKTGRHLVEALIRELRRAAAASKMGLLSGRALRMTAALHLVAVKRSRTGPLLGEAGSRTGAPRRAARRLVGTGNPKVGVCGAAAAQLLRGRRPRGPRDAGASRSLAAGRTARPTRRTTGAAAAATRRRRRHLHPLFPPV